MGYNGEVSPVNGYVHVVEQKVSKEVYNGKEGTKEDTGIEANDGGRD